MFARTLIAVLAAMTMTAFAANPPERAAPGLPQDLQARLRASHLLDTWEIDRTVTPLYQLGDFDGDAKRDYAVCLKAKQGNACTLAVLLGTQKVHVLCSEKEIGNNYPRPDWALHARKDPVPSRPDINGGRVAPVLAGDAIELSRPESSSALLYWSNGHLRLYWLSD